MVQMEQADEFAQEPQIAQYVVQVTTRFVCPLECMPGLLIASIILKSSRKNMDKLWGSGGENTLEYSTVRSPFLRGHL